MWLFCLVLPRWGNLLSLATRPSPVVSVELALRVACDCALTKINEMRSFQNCETSEAKKVMLLFMYFFFHTLWLINWLSVYLKRIGVLLFARSGSKNPTMKFDELQNLCPLIINYKFKKISNIPRGCKTNWIDELSQVNSTETLKETC